MKRAPVSRGATPPPMELQGLAEAAPSDVAALMNIARTCARLGRDGDATKHFERAHLLAPHDPVILLELGNVQYRAGRHAAAMRTFRDAMRLAPAWSSPVANLAACQVATFDYASAVDSYRAALALDAHDAAAINGYGAALHLAGRFAEAVDWLTAALANDPGDVVLRLNLGRALREHGDLDRSVRVFEDVATADEHASEICEELATSLVLLRRYDEAGAALERAVALTPKRARVYLVLGNLRAEEGRLAEAVASYSKALRLDPHLAIAQWNRALASLELGDYRNGWADYEARWRCAEFPSPRRRRDIAPLTDPARAVGKTVLVHAEQGFGDTLHFCRFCTALAARGIDVIVEVQPELCRVLQNLEGVKAVVPSSDDPIACDFQTPMASLPLLLRQYRPTSGTKPYVVPHSLASTRTRRRPFLRVGLVWAGGQTHRRDGDRSLALEAFLPLLALDGVRVYGLQKVMSPESLQVIGRLGSAGRRLALGTRFVDFDETANVIAKLDLVVCVDTAVAHLAGAMHRRLFLVLPYRPDFRWGREGAGTAWYPSATLYRCERPGAWDDVIDRIRIDLEALRQSRGP